MHAAQMVYCCLVNSHVYVPLQYVVRHAERDGSAISSERDLDRVVKPGGCRRRWTLSCTFGHMIESTTRHGARRYTELPNANNKIKRIGGGREREKRGPKLKRGAVSKERKERKEGRKQGSGEKGRGASNGASDAKPNQKEQKSKAAGRGRMSRERGREHRKRRARAAARGSR